MQSYKIHLISQVHKDIEFSSSVLVINNKESETFKIVSFLRVISLA